MKIKYNIKRVLYLIQAIIVANLRKTVYLLSLLTAITCFISFILTMLSPVQVSVNSVGSHQISIVSFCSIMSGFYFVIGAIWCFVATCKIFAHDFKKTNTPHKLMIPAMQAEKFTANIIASQILIPLIAMIPIIIATLMFAVFYSINFSENIFTGFAELRHTTDNYVIMNSWPNAITTWGVTTWGIIIGASIVTTSLKSSAKRMLFIISLLILCGIYSGVKESYIPVYAMNWFQNVVMVGIWILTYVIYKRIPVRN